MTQSAAPIPLEATITGIKQSVDTLVPLQLVPDDPTDPASVALAVVAADDDAVMELRKRYDDAEPVATLSKALGTITLDPALNTITLHFLGAQTKTWFTKGSKLRAYGTLLVTTVDGTPRAYSGSDYLFEIEGSYTR